MREFYLQSVIFCVVLLVPGCLKKNVVTDTSSSYLGQTPPGRTPAVFGPGIINTEDKNHSSVTVSPDGMEMFWSLFSSIDNIRQERIWTVKMEQGSWSRPRVASFSGLYRDGQPAFSPNGKMLYFSSERPVSPDDSSGDANIWYVERQGFSWSAPVSLNTVNTSENSEWFPSVTRDGTLYFSMNVPGSGSSWDIYAAEYRSGMYEKPVKLSGMINGLYADMTPFIAPDERFLLFFSERPDGRFEDGRLFISYRLQDGTWGEAHKLGGFFDTAASRFPSLSTDGMYLFFTRLQDHKEDVCWVEADILHKTYKE